MDHKQKAILRKLEAGRPDFSEVKKANDEFTDWWTVCRRCSQHRHGTPEQLRKPHRCKNGHKSK